ncbi:MAG: Ig-like domain-containing protein [Patescibacteria group bacterium]
MTNIKVVVGALVVLVIVSLIAVGFRGQRPSRVDVPPITAPAETTKSGEAPSAGEQVPSTTGTMTLMVTSPANGATVTNASLTVSGKTAPRAEVFVNEKETKADANGNFSVNITLDEGENSIVLIANDADGNVAEKELTVTYNSGQ